MRPVSLTLVLLAQLGAAQTLSVAALEDGWFTAITRPLQPRSSSAPGSLIRRLDPDLNVIWEQTTENSYARALRATPDGGVVLLSDTPDNASLLTSWDGSGAVRFSKKLVPGLAQVAVEPTGSMLAAGSGNSDDLPVTPGLTNPPIAAVHAVSEFRNPPREAAATVGSPSSAP